MIGYSEELTQIKELLTHNPKGLTVTDISEKLKTNRNSIAKYLDVLETAGHTEVKIVGPAKLYFLSERVPLSAMLNFSSDFILLLNANNEVIQLSSNIKKLFLEDKEFFIGKNISDIDLWLFQDKDFLEAHKKAEKGTESKTAINHGKNHKRKSIIVKCIPTIFESKSSGITIIIEDITKEKIAEEKIIESEEKFRNIAENSPNMIFINKNGKIVFANKRCEDMGYTREEFYSNDFDFMRLIAGESVELIRQNLAKHMAGKDVDPYEYKLLKKDGTKLHSIINVKLIQYEGDTAILGIVTDITDMKKAELAVQKSQGIYRQILDTIDSPIHIVDSNLQIYYCNKALLEWHNELNITTKLIGKNIFEIYPFLGDEIVEEYLKVLKEKKQLFTTESTVIDGKKITTKTMKIPIIEKDEVKSIITIIKKI